MKIKALLTVFAITSLLYLGATSAFGQSQLNKVRIGQCIDQVLDNRNRAKAEEAFADATARENEKRRLNRESIEDWIEAERKRGLVIDSRPFAINQSTGRLSFNGKTGRVSVVHMNPFLFNYTISVAQEELVSTAVSDFLKLLLPQGLRSSVGLQSGKIATEAKRSVRSDKLAAIEARLKKHPAECPAEGEKSPACAALDAMYDDLQKIQEALNGLSIIEKLSDSAEDDFDLYKANLVKLRDQESDAYTTCVRATTLNSNLQNFPNEKYFSGLTEAQRVITSITDLANDLQNLTTSYDADDVLKNTKPIPRCAGFSCVAQFAAYARAVNELVGGNGYQGKLNGLKATAEEMKAARDLTNEMKGKEGLFARTFEITKKFELTQATVTVARASLKENDDQAGQRGGQSGEQSGKPETQNPKPSLTGGSSTSGTGPNGEANEATGNGSDDDKSKNKDKASDDKEDSQGNGNGNNLAGQINESIQIGRPRFLLSGGLVFSPLRRRTFETVKGFTLDGDGNPTGDGNKDVVGFGENSPRRLMPMVILNSRLFSLNPTSVFFSLGATAKHDDNVDVEYLLGPSVSLLNDRALFTFGAYVGKVQNLVPDVKIGDEIPDSVGDAKLFTKRNSWKPGFSFSYVFSKTEKRGEAGSGGGGGSTANDLKNEIRIGGIPFNLALGLAYTSLEERNFDEVVGFARDRQGNLTNGKTLTRIVGLTSSSNYRMVPLALLHSRLLNFGNHSFYFSTGVTGSKTDNDVDIEYLLGGSVNLYRRKVFFTAGAFAGKQQLLGGDFFTGAKLDTTQNVTMQKRYVWKPAFAISYDISKIIPKGSN